MFERVRCCFTTFASLIFSLAFVGEVYGGTVPGSIPGSFNVTLSGSASYSLPIKIAPGAGGTEPKIQLTYDSQAPAGVLGAGWYLSGLSVITRGPKEYTIDGVSGGVTLTDTDALYIDGQRIIPVSSSSSIGNRQRQEFRKIIDDQTRIFRIGPDLDHSFFTAQTKGGLTIVFGNSENASGNPGDSVVRFDDGRVLGFAESLAIDTAGNVIEFHYDQNKGDYNISHIDYTGHGHLSVDGKYIGDQRPFASITFEYTSAPRPLETFVGGHALLKDKRLAGITSCVSDVRLASGETCRAGPSYKGKQVTHYKFDFDDTSTANRFLLKSVRMSGEEESIELPPTRFHYSAAHIGWTKDPFTFPSSAVLAEKVRLGAGYRFTHFAAGGGSAVDLLFSVKTKVGLKSSAFTNERLDPADPFHSLWKTSSDFAPPIPFIDDAANDLGVIVADITGDGRADLLQNNIFAGIQSNSSFIAGTSKFELNDKYRLPFVVSRDGKPVATYRLANWTGGKGLDMIFESEGVKGFLKNSGPSVGWEMQPSTYNPPVDLDLRSHLIDLDCNNGRPSLIGAERTPDGHFRWRVFRFSPSGWQSETRAEFQLPFSADTDPQSVRQMKLDFEGNSCDALIVATHQASGNHAAFVASASGWKSFSNKTPPFDLVDAQGRSSGAIVADVDGDGLADVIANKQFADGSRVVFAYRQTSAGWIPDPKFRPPLLEMEGGPASSVFVGDIDGQAGSDILFPDDVRSLPDQPDWKTGQIFTSDGTQFITHMELGLPLASARQDKQDLGVRFVDLHGKGLSDIVFSRQVVENGKTTLVSGAYRNTGTGWVAEPGDCLTAERQKPDAPTGLCPPLPFAGDEITGNPVQFLDLDGDGFADMIYSYRDKNGNVTTKIYLNVNDTGCVSSQTVGDTCRKWSELSVARPELAKLIPPTDIFPLASFGIGDMGVRFTKLNSSRLGVMVGFRGSGQNECHDLVGVPGIQICGIGLGAFRSKAYVLNSDGWKQSDEYAPPIPFVTQYDSDRGRSLDLSVQIVDAVGGGLPCLVAGYTDPIIASLPWVHGSATTNHVWTNNGNGWDANNGISLPYLLDAATREPKTFVQVVDLNGDGLPDIVMTKGGCAGCSKTWLGTGTGWVERPRWTVPDNAIGDRDGDPSFRLVDTKGDGYLDLIWIRTNSDGSISKGLFLNNGTDWSTKGPDSAIPNLSFTDKDGVDQGVRLLSVTGKGLTDVVQAFAGKPPVVERNNGRRADVIVGIIDGYGIATRIFYETLLEPDGADCPRAGPDCRSGVPEGGPLGRFAYERGPPDAYPLIAPIPTMYVVRNAEVDEGDGRSTPFFYRYGGYRVDALLNRPLGFRWRESLNSVSSILSRTDFIQDVRLRGGVARESSCLVHQQQLSSWPADKDFPHNLCPEGGPRTFSWGQKINETRNCWAVLEGDLHSVQNEVQLPANSECGPSPLSNQMSGLVIRQSRLSKTFTTTYELDGNTITAGTDTFEYELADSILHDHGNVKRTVNSLADGTSIETENVYRDDPDLWFLGRLMRTISTKIGDPTVLGGTVKWTERRCASFQYASDTGLLSSEVSNCLHPKAVKSHYTRDEFGNIDTKTTTSEHELTQSTSGVYDALGRFQIQNVDTFGHKIKRINGITNGLPLSQTDLNGLVSTFAYDSFGRLIRQVNPDGVIATTEIVSDRSLLPRWNTSDDIASGLPVTLAYATKTKIGPLPPTWILFDRKGRSIRSVSDGFAPDGTSHRYIFKEVEYDRSGNVKRSSLPHEASLPAIWSTNEYDALQRVCASTATNGLRTETLFAGLSDGGARMIVVVDPKKQLSEPKPDDPSNGLLSCSHTFASNLYRADALDRRTSSRINMRKQLVQTADAKGSIRFEYDAGGRVVRLIGPLGEVTTNVYDELGNKIETTDPDLGLWHYTFDAFGRVIGQVDAKGQLSTMNYDQLGRPKSRVTNDITTTWIYDTARMGIGKLASVSSSNGYHEAVFYDEHGRLARDVVGIGTEQFVTSTDYDFLGRVEVIHYPSAFAVRNRYDRKGFLVAISDLDSGALYWSAKDIDIFGRVTNETFGNKIRTVRRYSGEDLRLKGIETSGLDGKPILDLRLQFDIIGNLQSRSEKVDNKREKFRYDYLDRLASVDQQDGRRFALTYDAGGRIRTKQGVGMYKYSSDIHAGDGVHYASDTREAQGGCAKPFHAVLQTKFGRRTQHYCYDRNGSMISSPDGRIEYDADNRVSLLYANDSKWSRFEYGPDGNRFRQFSRDNGRALETTYVGGFERIVDYSTLPTNDYLRPVSISGPERLTRFRHYISNGSGVFAFVETQKVYANMLLDNPTHKPSFFPIGEVVTKEAWYLHPDQLGSILRITDQNGHVRERIWYDAWGQRQVKLNDQPGKGERQKLAQSWTRGFTGHEHLDLFGLIHMNGRVFNPVLALFLTVDPINQMTTDTHSGNGYIYARDNPLRYIDPSGMGWFGDLWEGAKHFVGGIAQGVGHFFNEAGKWLVENWRTIVIVAAVVVVTVVTGGAGAGLAGAILSGMAAGATGGALGAALYGGSFEDILSAAVQGALIGGLTGAASYGVSYAFSGAAGSIGSPNSIGSVAAHGAVGGGSEALRGGDFWQGFAGAAASQIAYAYGPDTRIRALNIVKSAVVGGTVAGLSGGKFANGALSGALAESIEEGLAPKSGRPLTAAERQIYKGEFSEGILDDARVHEGDVPFWLASDKAAVTIGNDIYINAGAYKSTTTEGAMLLGHELTHVNQYQNGMNIADYIWSTRHGYMQSKYEKEAYGNQPNFKKSFCRGNAGNLGCVP